MAPSLAAARTQEAPCDASVASRKFVEELFSVRGMVVWSAGACSRLAVRKLASAAAQSSSRSKLRLGESGGSPPLCSNEAGFGLVWSRPEGPSPPDLLASVSPFQPPPGVILGRGRNMT